MTSITRWLASARAAIAGLLVVTVIGAPPATAAVVVGASAAVECDGQPATITGTEGADVIHGTDGPDVIAGLGGDDLIHGHGGDDTICGGDGSDLLRGGDGDDRLFGEAEEQFRTGDILIGGAGSDYLDGSGYNADIIRYGTEPAGIHADLQAGIVTTSRGTDTIVWATRTPVIRGSRYDDVIDGSEVPDGIFGLQGDDTINGGGGRNSLYGGAGNDTLTGGPTLDNLYGGRGDDVLDSVGIGLDAWLDGGPGDDHLIGTDGWDHFLYGGPGNDLIEGFGDDDRLWGGPGDDTLDGGTGSDKGRAGPGTDTCISIERRKQCEDTTTAHQRLTTHAGSAGRGPHERPEGPTMAHEPSSRPATGGATISRRTVLGAIIAVGVIAPLIGTGTAHADTDEPPGGEDYEIPDGIGSVPWW